MIRPSNIIYMAGSTSSTTLMLINAPLAIRLHSDAIMSMLDISPTPKVAEKKLRALTMTDFMLVDRAILVASFLSCPAVLSLIYLVVIRIA